MKNLLRRKLSGSSSRSLQFRLIWLRRLILSLLYRVRVPHFSALKKVQVIIITVMVVKIWPFSCQKELLSIPFDTESIQRKLQDTTGLANASLDLRVLAGQMSDRWNSDDDPGFIVDAVTPSDKKGFVVGSVPRLIAIALIRNGGKIPNEENLRGDLFQTGSEGENRWEHWARFIDVLKDKEAADNVGLDWLWTKEGQDLVRLITARYIKPILQAHPLEQQEIALLGDNEGEEWSRPVSVPKKEKSPAKKPVAKKDKTPNPKKGAIPANAQAYINLYASTAVSEMVRSQIPASITLAQGLLESGTGSSDLSSIYHNHFGIKCLSSYAKHRKGTGCRRKSCKISAHWYYPACLHPRRCKSYADDTKHDRFRNYENAWESYRDHSNFLVEYSRYNFLWRHGRDYRAWAYGLKAAGYATGRGYAEKLIGLIERYELYKYDRQ